MIDLHTHLLPAWDDGAEDWRETDQLCEMAWQDGITKIVLTPHVYRLSKNNDDFGLLEKRIAEFNSRVKKSPIDFYRGAEVFLDPDIAGSLRERNLTINGSDAVLDNKPIPDYGDPSRPEKAHSKWSICFPRKRE